MSKQPELTGGKALLAAAGILLSRVAGLLRQRVFAHYLGSSLAAAAFQAALRIPNFLQNLFGEGVLSASFIPVYAGLAGAGRRDEADRLAGAIFGLLALTTAILCAAGIAATPLFVDLIAPGFHGEVRLLAIQLVRILFPGIGLLVLSAWCLGILNSHERVFLPYAAPVLWNGAIIAALFLFGPRSSQPQLAVYVAWGAVAGSALQLGVQVRAVGTLLGRFLPSLSLSAPGVRQVLATFAAVIVGRGVVQLSAYIDTAFASLITPRVLALLGYAQLVYLLPVSLFATATVAAELPGMARAAAGADAASLNERITRGLPQLAFFVIPSAAAFLVLGDVVAGALLQTGRFGPSDTRFVWYLLIGSSVGLVAQAMGRLYANAFYAIKDARTPLRYAVLRVALTTAGAWYAVTRLPGDLGVPRELGGAGITATAGVAAWLEYLLLRRTLARRTGQDPGLPPGRLLRLWCAAILAAAAALGLKALLVHVTGSQLSSEWGAGVLPMPRLHPVATALVVLGPYGLLYFGLAHLFGVPQSSAALRRLRRR